MSCRSACGLGILTRIFVIYVPCCCSPEPDAEDFGQAEIAFDQIVPLKGHTDLVSHAMLPLVHAV